MRSVFLLAMDGGEPIKILLITIGVIVVLFLILREVICWYYKINERLTAQKETNFILQDVLSQLKSIKVELSEQKKAISQNDTVSENANRSK